jgi:hypothetical protein
VLHFLNSLLCSSVVLVLLKEEQGKTEIVWYGVRKMYGRVHKTGWKGNETQII